MAQDSAWFRLNVNWYESDWIADLESMGARFAWVMFLCHVKERGKGGVAPVLSLSGASVKWRIPKADIEEMLGLAQTCGAITIEDGYWAVLNWDKYQKTDNTAAERQRRFKESHPTEKVEKVTAGNAVDRRYPVARTPDSIQETISSSGEEEKIELPREQWWTAPCVEPLLSEVVAAIVRVPRFAKTWPDRPRCERLLADQRTRAPDDEAIRYELDGFTAYYLNSKKYTDGIATLRSWFGNKHDKWATMRKRVGPMTQGVKNVASELQEAMNERIGAA